MKNSKKCPVRKRAQHCGVKWFNVSNIVFGVHFCIADLTIENGAKPKNKSAQIYNDQKCVYVNNMFTHTVTASIHLQTRDSDQYTKDYAFNAGRHTRISLQRIGPQVVFLPVLATPALPHDEWLSQQLIWCAILPDLFVSMTIIIYFYRILLNIIHYGSFLSFLIIVFSTIQVSSVYLNYLAA